MNPVSHLDQMEGVFRVVILPPVQPEQIEQRFARAVEEGKLIQNQRWVDDPDGTHRIENVYHIPGAEADGPDWAGVEEILYEDVLSSLEPGDVTLGQLGKRYGLNDEEAQDLAFLALDRGQIEMLVFGDPDPAQPVALYSLSPKGRRLARAQEKK
jgi:hypothetical protein